MSTQTERNGRCAVYRSDFYLLLVVASLTAALTDVSLARNISGLDDSRVGTLRLETALTQVALRDKIFHRLLEEFLRAFSPMVDFTIYVQPGDFVEMIPDGTGDRLAFGSLSISGSVQTLYRFTTLDGREGFYDSLGRSADKQLLPKPLLNGLFESGYALHRHPILNYEKLHTGVDWKAAENEPIYATGAGIIESAGRDESWGNAVLIRHDGTLETRYAHLAGIAPGIEVGTEVGRTQILGYVGSDGPSAGPHVHYEVRFEGVPIDPMKAELAPIRTLDGLDRIRFETQRTNVETLRMRLAPESIRTFD